MNSYFPDVNAWIALAYRGHQHHGPAAEWFEELDAETVYFCRITQLAFLRLLCHPSVMGDEVKSQREAWGEYHSLLGDGRCAFHAEPEDRVTLETTLRALTSSRRAAPKQFSDAYLAAFAQVAGLTLVTFDHALHHTAAGWSVLLG